MAARPDELLGLAVLGPDGRRLGEALDVGLVDWWRPKFLLVEGEDWRVLRIDYG